MLCALRRHLHMLLDIPLEAPDLARMKMETRAVDDPATGPCLLLSDMHEPPLNVNLRKCEEAEEGPACDWARLPWCMRI